MTMRFRSKVIVLVCSGFLFGAAQTARAQCDQMLSPGANVASAVASAPDGSTICLTSGDYGTVSLSNVNKSSFVTLSSASGTTPTMTLTVSNSSYIRLKGIRFDWSAVLGSSFHHIEYVDSTFLPNGNGLYFNTESDSPPSTDQALRVDGCVFTNVGIALWDGRLNVRGVRGLKITNSVFSGSENSGEKSDGIMLIGGSRQVEIGPGNEFHSFRQDAATQGEHIDSIQIYGAGPDNKIIGNYFHDSDVFMMAADGSDRVTFENNVFDGRSHEYPFKVTMQAAASMVVRHNTFYNAQLRISNKDGDAVSSNAVVENNIFLGFGGITVDGAGCNNCKYQSNLFDDSGDGRGTYVTGTPNFVGGALPTRWTGWQLASGSVGENRASDGKDMGTLYYGSGVLTPGDPPDPTPDPDPDPTPDPDPDPDPTPNPTAPAPPTGLRVIR